MMLSSIFMEAVNDPGTTSMDGKGYKARMKLGIKIAQDIETKRVKIYDLSSAGNYYVEMQGENLEIILNQGWSVGVYKITLEKYKKKLDRIKLGISSELNGNKSNKRLLYLKEARSKTINKKSTFDVLNAINVNDRTEKKGQLTYLSWSWAWQEVKKTFPDATYWYYKNPETNLPFSYKEDVGAFCHTSVTIKGETLEMWLPVMDNRNQSVLKPTSTQINNTLMRCLTKNLAMHGMGLYIYAGEDIPQITAEEISKSNEESKSKKVKVTDENWSKIVETSKRLQSQKVKWDTILARLMDKYIVDIPQTERLKKELYGK